MKNGTEAMSPTVSGVRRSRVLFGSDADAVVCDHDDEGVVVAAVRFEPVDHLPYKPVPKLDLDLELLVVLRYQPFVLYPAIWPHPGQVAGKVLPPVGEVFPRTVWDQQVAEVELVPTQGDS